MRFSTRCVGMALGIVCSLVMSLTTPLAWGCSRILMSNDAQAMMVGRNMDWFEDMRTNLWVFPRHMKRDGLDRKNPLIWRSNYGSIVATAYDKIATDGMNEAGLAAHILSLKSNYGVRDERLPGLSVTLWLQFYLDQFATVAEAVHFTETHPLQILPYLDPQTKRYIMLHLALEDATGDSVVIEYTDGRVHIYHGKQFSTLTNDPPLPAQLENLKKYQGFGGDKPLPGTTSPADRFVRATYYLKTLRTPLSDREKMTELFSVLHNVSEPYETQPPRTAPTIWSTVSDLTHQIYYFNSYDRFNTIWVFLNKFNLKPGAPVLKLDLASHLDHPEWAGEVTLRFVPV